MTSAAKLAPGGLGAVLLLEQGIEVLIGIERRIKIDEIDGLVLDVELEDLQVVPVEGDVAHHGPPRLVALPRL